MAGPNTATENTQDEPGAFVVPENKKQLKTNTLVGRSKEHPVATAETS